MSKYNVRFSCGHDETVELFGKYADRERKIDYYKNHGLCSECYKLQKISKEESEFKDFDEVEMHYGEYKNNYSDCKTKTGSYNASTKTIVVYVPKSEVVKEEVANLVDEFEEKASEVIKINVSSGTDEKEIQKAQKRLDGVINLKNVILNSDSEEIKAKISNWFVKTKDLSFNSKMKELMFSFKDRL